MILVYSMEQPANKLRKRLNDEIMAFQRFRRSELKTETGYLLFYTGFISISVYCQKTRQYLPYVFKHQIFKPSALNPWLKELHNCFLSVKKFTDATFLTFVLCSSLLKLSKVFLGFLLFQYVNYFIFHTQ